MINQIDLWLNDDEDEPASGSHKRLPPVQSGEMRRKIKDSNKSKNGDDIYYLPWTVVKVQRDISVLLHPGNVFTADFWSTGWIMQFLRDKYWKTTTGGGFPGKFNDGDPEGIYHGHPLYVLRELGNFHMELCPMTTRCSKMPYIPEGSVLEVTGVVQEKNSYVLTRYTIKLGRNARFPKPPSFKGVWQPEKLVSIDK